MSFYLKFDLVGEIWQIFLNTKMLQKYPFDLRKDRSTFSANKTIATLSSIHIAISSVMKSMSDLLSLR